MNIVPIHASLAGLLLIGAIVAACGSEPGTQEVGDEETELFVQAPGTKSVEDEQAKRLPSNSGDGVWHTGRNPNQRKGPNYLSRLSAHLKKPLATKRQVILIVRMNVHRELFVPNPNSFGSNMLS